MVSPEVMKQVVLQRMARKQEYIEMNSRAFDIGVEYAKSMKA